MKKIAVKVTTRLPNGKMYMDLKQKKHAITREQNPMFKELMLLLYKAQRDIYIRGEKISGSRYLARNINVYNGLKEIFHAKSVPKKDAVRFKDLVLPVPRDNERNIFVGEFIDVVLHYMVGLENINHFCAFQKEGSYESPKYISVEKGDIVLDCGANLGLYSAVASREGGGGLCF